MNPKRARIQFAGTGGIGKTEVARVIADRTGLELRKSRAREIQESYNMTDKEQYQWQPKDLWQIQSEIFKAQHLQYTVAGPYVSDRSSVDSFAYSLQRSPRFMTPEVLNFYWRSVEIELRSVDLVVLLPFPPHFAPECDNFRDLDPGILLSHHLLLEAILARCIPENSPEVGPTLGLLRMPDHILSVEARADYVIGCLMKGSTQL